MEFKRCPVCSSTYFFSSRSAGRIVFQVDTNKNCIAVENQKISDDHEITSGSLHCGACSWDGDITELLSSQD